MVKHKRRKSNQMANQAVGIVGSSVTLGLGSQVLGGIGGTSATNGQKALANMSKYQPMMGTMYGAGRVLKSLKKLKKY